MPRSRQGSLQSPAEDTDMVGELKLVTFGKQNNYVIGGHLKEFTNNWEKYTLDNHILQAVKGMRIQFIGEIPGQNYISLATGKVAIDTEINRLLQIG